jgi:hypothetical protein
MPSSTDKGDIYDSRAFFGDLGRDWRDRLRDIAPYQPVVPQTGLILPGQNVVADLYGNAVSDWRGLSVKDTPAIRSFYDAYGKYQGDLKKALENVNAVPIRQRFARFAQDTGLGDYEPSAEYNNPGAFNAAQHEIYAHQIPFEEGFAPDYRNFYAGTNRSGSPVVIAANTAFPLNENLAEIGERDLGAAFRNKPLNDPAGYKDVFSGRNTDSFRLAALGYKGNFLDPPSKELLDTRIELSYPSEYRNLAGERVLAPQPRNAQLDSYLTEAGRLFQEKYVLPAAQQMRGLLQSQFPGLGSPGGTAKLQKGSDLLPNQYLRLLQELDKKYGGNVGDLGNFYYSLDPVSAAVRALPEAIGHIMRTPASLLPGVADLIPSPEAVQTGYAQGPVAMGKQMGKEFLQSLPTSVAAASALATPLLAPLAPGIGAGLVGTAGARALNEVVRQETGEGIVPKLRQAIGTAPRTGVASPQRTTPAPLTQQIKPLTAAQRVQMQQRANRNELQRRVDRAREVFNPRKGEFGISELLGIGQK